MVAIGELEGLPYSITALADALREPRSTTSRKVNALAANGLLRVQPDRDGKRLYLTERGWRRLDNWWAALDGPLDIFVRSEGKRGRD